MTSQQADFIKKKGLESGANDFLQKPFSFQKIIEKINLFLK